MDTDEIGLDALARMLSAGDVQINRGDYPDWDTLSEIGRDEYRKLAHYLLARCTIVPIGTIAGAA
jgi:hypothetical protein